jgi:hypothetical protein
VSFTASLTLDRSGPNPPPPTVHIHWLQHIARLLPHLWLQVNFAASAMSFKKGYISENPFEDMCADKDPFKRDDGYRRSSWGGGEKRKEHAPPEEEEPPLQEALKAKKKKKDKKEKGENEEEEKEEPGASYETPGSSSDKKAKPKAAKPKPKLHDRGDGTKWSEQWGEDGVNPFNKRDRAKQPVKFAPMSYVGDWKGQASVTKWRTPYVHRRFKERVSVLQHRTRGWVANQKEEMQKDQQRIANLKQNMYDAASETSIEAHRRLFRAILRDMHMPDVRYVVSARI